VGEELVCTLGKRWGTGGEINRKKQFAQHRESTKPIRGRDLPKGGREQELAEVMKKVRLFQFGGHLQAKGGGF